MGFFKRKSKDTGAEASAEAETQKMESIDTSKEQSAADAGRERVGKMKEGVSSLWARLKARGNKTKDAISSRASQAMDAVLGTAKKGKDMAVEGAFAAVGGIERGGKAAVEGVKDAVEYTAESGRELMELGELAVQASKNAAERTKDMAVELGLTGAALTFMAGEAGVKFLKDTRDAGIDLATEAGKAAVAKAAELKQKGVDAGEAIKQYGVDRLDDVSEAADKLKQKGIDIKDSSQKFLLDSALNALDAGVDLAIALEGAALDTMQKGKDIVEAAGAKIEGWKTKAKEAKDGFFTRLSDGYKATRGAVVGKIIEALSPEIQNIVAQQMADRETAMNMDFDEGAETAPNEAVAQ
ncbi:MAG: hypothetical protein HQ488_00985 [Parcubacteria group bacterium]|nr:hypothetical protein [Parcubacteria group bacterium]